jgi:hypothetical protein
MRSWAKLLHDHIPGLEGHAWSPRLAGQGEAYVFLGDRCGRRLRNRYRSDTSDLAGRVREDQDRGGRCKHHDQLQRITGVPSTRASVLA